jgi:starch synthase
MLRILFVTPELHPFNKTGGLGDVSNSLVRSLNQMGIDVRLGIPGYPAIRRHMDGPRPILPLIDERGREGCLVDAELDGLRAFVVDFPAYYDKLDHPYQDSGSDGIDDASRFFELARAATRIGLGQVPDWKPDVIHCNDWTTGMVPLLLHQEPDRPGTVFTIHNLAYQGLFSKQRFDELGLDPMLWTSEGVEFYHQLSFMKAGLVFADRINTVSPTYAREIMTPEFGCGLDGLLQKRSDELSGVLNGVDYSIWHPSRDPHIEAHYDVHNLNGKHQCKRALQKQLQLELLDVPLFGVVSRLTEQKGIDVLLECLDELIDSGVQLVVLGTGDASLETRLARAAASVPGRIAVTLDYDEPLAHQIIAGADFFLMPSRFEPCGLTQLYSLAYGTVPIVHSTGGLADTVKDVDGQLNEDCDATGLCYTPNTASILSEAIGRAIGLFDQPAVMHALRRNAMCQEFSWTDSAGEYLSLYQAAMAKSDGPY